MNPAPQPRSPRRSLPWLLGGGVLGLLGLAALALGTLRNSGGELSGPIAVRAAHPTRDFGEIDHPSASSEEREDAGPQEVAIRVVDGDKPVAGARVQLVPLDDAHGSKPPACACSLPREPDLDAEGAGERSEDDEPVQDTPSDALDSECATCVASVDALFELADRGAGFLPQAEAQTGADGVARFPVSAESDFAVWVEARGFAPAALLPQTTDAPADPEDLALSRPKPHTIRVVDASGELVPSAQVAFFASAPFRPLGAVRAGPEQHLSELPTGTDVNVLARAPGYLSTIALVDPEDQDALEITLEHPQLVRGRVLHGDAPVAGATVALRHEGGQLGNPTAKSDAEGRFQFPAIPPGAYLLVGDLGPLHGEQEVEISEGDDAELALLVSEPARIEGTVTAAESHQPLEGARVELSDQDSNFHSGEVDAQGHYELRCAPGHYELEVADGVHLREVHTLVLAEGQVVHLDIALSAGETLSGQVQDSHGAPIGDAHVSVEISEGPDGSSSSHAGLSDEHGSFALKGLPAGKHLLTVEATGHPALSQPVQLPSGPLSLRLRDGAAIEGVVLGPDGPLAEARVEVGADSRRASASGETDPQGHFRIEGLSAGTSTVVAVSSGYSASDPTSLEVKEGQTVQVELHLAAGVKLEGRVEDDTGKPVSDAIVEAYSEGGARPPLPGRTASTSSAADGTFTLRELHAGNYRLFAYHDGLAQAAPLPATAGSRDVVVQLQRSGKVTGRVVTSSGTPVRRFSAEGQEFHTADGAFTVRDVSPDVAEIFIEGPFPTVKVPVQVQLGESIDVGTITVDDGQAISGRVLGANGLPAAGARVTELPPNFDLDSESPAGADAILDSPRTITADPDGRFTFSHLRAGPYQVQAMTSAGSSPAVRAAAGGPEVELVLQAGAQISGAAALADGTPLPEGLAIFVSGAVTTQVRVLGGSFELSGLPAGEGQLLVSGYVPGSGQATTAVSLTLASGETRSLNVVLAERRARSAGATNE